MFFVAAAFSIAEDALPSVVQPVLVEPGDSPFHLSAVITERADFNQHVDVELYWISPTKWKRTITSQDFSQTLIVNGDNTFEQDSDDYFPLGLQALATALVDPRPALQAWRPGDPLLTKANGAADESGKVCFNPQRTMCGISRLGLMETIGAPGQFVTFSDYQPFNGKRVARLVTYKIDQGDSLQARVSDLEAMKSIDDKFFAIDQPTPKEKQIKVETLAQAELSQQALQPMEIIWPQVLDGHTSGETSYFVSIDRTGQVRDVLPLDVEIERANDSAVNQIRRWKFKPLIMDGVTLQMEGVLQFAFNTRAYGPADMLTDEEGRKYATTIVEPDYPTGAVAGSTCTVRVAVDADGKVIEMIIGDCSPGLGQPCFKALGKWRFSPIVQGGKSLPYRAQIVFRVP
jgi:hypothetical protein